MSRCAGCDTGQSAAAFLGRPFTALEQGDWPALDAFLRAHPHTLAGYTLSSLAAWNFIFDYRFSFYASDTLLLSFCFSRQNERHLLEPVGLFPAEDQEALLRAAGELPYALKIVGVTREFVHAHPSFASRFRVDEDRNNFNYIYKASDLALLAGRRYSKKRNLLSQAAREYAWTAEPVTADNIRECLAVVGDIECSRLVLENGNLEQDICAVRSVVNQFSRLALEGVLVRVEGGPAAFALFETQSPDTAVVHFEHAVRSYKGIYQVVNQAAANAILERGFAFINREEDLGDPGLRQSKESYHPVRMAEALVMTYGG